MSLPKLLTKKEVAEVLRCTTKTVETLHNNGDLKGKIKMGKDVLWPEDEILKFIARRTVKAS